VFGQGSGGACSVELTFSTGLAGLTEVPTTTSRRVLHLATREPNLPQACFHTLFWFRVLTYLVNFNHKKNGLLGMKEGEKKRKKSEHFIITEGLPTI